MHRHAAVGLIALAAIPICVLAWADARGEWARGQLAPATDPEWPGHQSFLARSWSSSGEVHSLRIEQHGEVVFEEVFVLQRDLAAREALGFVASLNADSDPALEIVHCDRGVIQAYVEPGWRNLGISEHPGTHASVTAKRVCAAYVRAIDWTSTTFCFLAGCVTPSALPIGVLFLYRRRRERAEAKQSGPLRF